MFVCLNYFQKTIDSKGKKCYNKDTGKTSAKVSPEINHRLKGNRLMNSISQASPLVKWREKKERNILIADKMMDAGFEERGKRMRFCGTFLVQSRCPDCGKSTISSANLCRDRLCPTCSWRLSLRRFAEMCSTMQLLTDIDTYDAGFLTLTVRNCHPSQLRFTLQKMAEDWNRMLAQRSVKGKIWGWAKSLEITYNKRTNTFHPHYHIIMLTNPNGMSQAQLHFFFREKWRVATRLPYEPITDYRTIGAFEHRDEGGIDGEAMAKAVLETYKYSVKSDELKGMPLDVFREFVTAISGIRFCTYGGAIKEARKQLGYKDTDAATLEGDDTIRIKCDCGGNMVDEFLQWSFTDGEYKHLKEVMKVG